jgi:hypothetical protein
MASPLSSSFEHPAKATISININTKLAILINFLSIYLTPIKKLRSVNLNEN